MPIYHGKDRINDIYKNNTKIGLIYKGHTLVYNSYKPERFDISPDFQKYIVPRNIHKLSIDCVASAGNRGESYAGKGGRVTCIIPVTPNQLLYIYVGKIPQHPNIVEYNASDIRTNNAGVLDRASLESRLVIAGGGGSGAYLGGTVKGGGGNGGGLIGQGTATMASYTGGAGGGTQTSGGHGGKVLGGNWSWGHLSADGRFALGGQGEPSSGGVGGSGYYGGGSGLTYHPHKVPSTGSSGGAGGSSFTSSICTEVNHTQGFNDGQGYIIITAMPDLYV